MKKAEAELIEWTKRANEEAQKSIELRVKDLNTQIESLTADNVWLQDQNEKNVKDLELAKQTVDKHEKNVKEISSQALKITV